jgi:c(7)-type cytochrome triheme protein
MRKLLAGVPALLLAMTFATYAQQKKVEAPDEITIKAKNGAILFNHKKHSDTAKADCKVCHDGLWPQNNTTPIGFKAPHKPLEVKKASCGACHHQGGAAFSASVPANCKKCHGTAKTAPATTKG